jgi:nicotinate-nucleotide pyrophosphorylase (carboxylating)
MKSYPFPYLTPESIRKFIQGALDEDLGTGDVSSNGAIPQDVQSKAVLKIKEDGVIAGIDLAQTIFLQLDPALVFEAYVSDGQEVRKGDVGFEVRGKARSIVSAERVVLNCLQRMSGIATKTRHMAQLIVHTKARLLDTRKTTPNSRLIEKWAVVIGGGHNHRFGLFDMVMLKDNHIDFAGGIIPALQAVHSYLKKNQLQLKVEVETRNLEEFNVALDSGLADIIMLDNYSIDNMRTAVELGKGRVPLEASGNVTEDTIVAIAETGVDFISVGALTHSYKSLDFSLKASV